VTAIAPGPMIDGTPNPISWLYGTPVELATWLAIKLEWPVRLLIAVSGLSLLARLRQRHARGRQRQQVKWLTYVGVLPAAALLVQLEWHPIGLVRATYLAVVAWAIYLAIGIAILRHRLYDIDRLINRTLVYGLLTAILGLIDAGGVFIVGQLLNPAGGESALAVAASTLAVAALLRPLRRRVQTAVDRRSTAAAMTRPRPWRPSAADCASTLAWRRSPQNSEDVGGRPGRPDLPRNWPAAGVSSRDLSA
jgi:hypothetical protein